MLLGWSRAILMQMAHPLIAAGVAEHSAFRDGPITAARRLRGTVRAMLALTFGSDEARERAVGRIKAIHRRVHGHLDEAVGRYPAGAPYSAEDPSLVLWVHATLLESTVMAYEAAVGPVPTLERDAYCDEAAVVAIELGAVPAAVPRTWDGLLTVLDGVYRSGDLAVGSHARLIGDALLSGPFAVLAGPAGWINRRVTIGWLPESIRALYGFEWRVTDERHLTRILGSIRRGRMLIPTALATWPDARRPVTSAK